MTKKIIVASKNPVKIDSARIGFEKMFPTQTFETKGIACESGVADQPMTSDETLLGANNRVTNIKKSEPESDFWVGIEGGIEKTDVGVEVFAWIIVASNTTVGKAQTGKFYLPQTVVSLINQGIELGDAIDVAFDKTNSKQSSGAVGCLTDGLIDRTKYYVEAMILALIPEKNSAIYIA